MTLFRVTPEFIRNGCKLTKDQHLCVKIAVYCCIRLEFDDRDKKDLYFFGSNWGRVKPLECPRDDGEGYEKCKSICHQSSHAEVDAIANAGDVDLTGATAYLTGHTRICDDCLKALKDAGIAKALLLDNGKEYTFGGVSKQNPKPKVEDK